MSSAPQPQPKLWDGAGLYMDLHFGRSFWCTPLPCVSKIQEIGSFIVRCCLALIFSLGTNILLYKTVKKLKV